MWESWLMIRWLPLIMKPQSAGRAALPNSASEKKLFLSQHATQLLVQAMVIPYIDDCVTLLTGATMCVVKLYQVLQNTDAYLVFNQLKQAPVTLLIELQWQVQVTYADLQGKSWICSFLLEHPCSSQCFLTSFYTWGECGNLDYFHTLFLIGRMRMVEWPSELCKSRSNSLFLQKALKDSFFRRTCSPNCTSSYLFAPLLISVYIPFHSLYSSALLY